MLALLTLVTVSLVPGAFPRLRLGAMLDEPTKAQELDASTLARCVRRSILLVKIAPKLQRRARRHATINAVDVRCQMSVTTCQNIRNVSEHMYPDKNVM